MARNGARCRRRISQAAQSMYCPESRQTPRSSKSQRGVIDMTQLRKLEEQVAAWSHVSVHPHRFGGPAFLFGNAQLAHVHLGRTIDLPFPPPVPHSLFTDGPASQH